MNEQVLEGQGQADMNIDGKGNNDQGAELQALLSGFTSISLEEMHGVSLLERTEVKYLLNLEILWQSLPELQTGYRALEVSGRRLNRYRTLYFDTDDFLLYRRHHMGARNRYKVRSREYMDTHLSFFEVKHKKGRRRTVKHRIPTREMVTSPGCESCRLLSQVSPYEMQELTPRSWNRYRRITLVANGSPERLTLDLGLTFYWGNRSATLPGIVVAEVKQPLHGGHSEFIDLMRDRRLRSTGFSKYCMGVSLMYPDMKQNRFKPIQRRIARLMEELTDVHN